MNERTLGRTEQAHTYACQNCDTTVTAASRPDGCPECGGHLHNATLDRNPPSADGADDARAAFTYECIRSGHRTTAEQRPPACPDCGGPVRNVTLEQQ